MSFLIKAAREEETENSRDLEELYMALFPKIARDFMHKEDVKVLIKRVIEATSEGEISVILREVGLDYNYNAERTAQEYKNLLMFGKTSNKKDVGE